MPVYQIGDLVQLRHDSDLGMILSFPMHTFYPSAEVLWEGDPEPSFHYIADLVPCRLRDLEPVQPEQPVVQ